MTQFAGIDYDTHAVHLVLINEDGQAAYHPFPLEGPDAFTRTRSVRDAMWPRTRWADEGVIALGIEEPAGRLTGRLFRVQGAILACLPPWLLVEKFMPSEWRKVVGMPGNASKGYVAEFAGSRLWPDAPLPVVPSPQDACDAYCLALAVSRLTEGVAA